MIFRGMRLLMQLSDIKFLLTSKQSRQDNLFPIIFSLIKWARWVFLKKKMPWRRDIFANKVDKGERISFFPEILILSEAIFILLSREPQRLLQGLI